MSCAFLHEFPFFKIKQQAGNCFTRYLQHREKQFPEKQFLCHFRNHSECCAWILKHLQYRTSHMALKKSNLGIHDASRPLNREINSRLDQIIFDLGIHSEDKTVMYAHLPSYCFIIALSHRFADLNTFYRHSPSRNSGMIVCAC